MNMEETKKRERTRKTRWMKTRKGKLWLRIALVALVLAVACVWLFVKTSTTGSLNGGSSGVYVVKQAVRRDLTVAVSGSGTLAPADSYNVTTLLSGEIEAADFEEGDLVDKGTVLFTMDSSDAQTSVDRANISVQQAQLAYDQAQEALHPTATISGIINELNVHNGDSVAPGTMIAKIISSKDLTIDFLFPFVAASEFYEGQSATVFINGFDGSVKGSVVSVGDAPTTTSTGMNATNVRVKVANPGAVSDSHTARASIGSYASYGNAPIHMAGNSIVFATASGTVTGLEKLAGSTVKAGEVLCTIESEAARTQVANASLALQNAQLAANTAADTVEDYKIESQIMGTVIEKNFKAGDKVEGMSSGSLAVIYDMSYLKMEIPVDELDIGKVAVGQEVEITADALPGETFLGVVDKVAIRGNTIGGATSYPVTVILEEYGNLRPGMNVSAKIIGERVNNALCIPLDAVKRGNVVEVPGPGAMNADGTAVAHPNKVEEKEISVGRNDDSYIEVTAGLEEGDTVLVFNKITTMMDLMMGG